MKKESVKAVDKLANDRLTDDGAKPGNFGAVGSETRKAFRAWFDRVLRVIKIPFKESR